MSKAIRISLSIVFLWLVTLIALYVLRNNGVRSPYILKMLPCSAYVLTAILGGAHRTCYGRVLFIGLCFAWGGDYLLIGPGWRGFHQGLWSFLIGHLLYGVAFLVRGVNRDRSLTAFAPLLVLGVLLYGWLRPDIPYEALAFSVGCYIIAIICMLSLAIGTLGRPASLVIYAGALCFFLSDIGVAYMHFKPHSGWAATEAGLLYISGQLLLAVSVALVNLDADKEPTLES